MERNEDERKQPSTEAALAHPEPVEDRNARTRPGGTLGPARTPGGTGPSTRDTAHAVADDANESLIGRVALAGEIHVKPTRSENDPDR